MRIYGCIASGAGQILVLPVGDVLMSARISELFGQTKIDYVDEIALFKNSIV